MIANSSLLGRARQISQRLKWGQCTGDEEYARWLKQEKSMHPRGAARWLTGDLRINSSTDKPGRGERRDPGMGREVEHEGEGMMGFDDDEGDRGGEACSAISDGQDDDDDDDEDDADADPEDMERGRGFGGGDNGNGWTMSGEEQEVEAAAATRQLEDPASPPVAQRPAPASANAAPCGDNSNESESESEEQRRRHDHTGLSPMIARQGASLEKAKAVRKALSDFLCSALETRTKTTSTLTSTSRRHGRRSMWEVAALSRAVCAWRMMVRAMAVMRAAVRKGRGVQGQQLQHKQVSMGNRPVSVGGAVTGKQRPDHASSIFSSKDTRQQRAAGRGVASNDGAVGRGRASKLHVPGKDIRSCVFEASKLSAATAPGKASKLHDPDRTFARQRTGDGCRAEAAGDDVPPVGAASAVYAAGRPRAVGAKGGSKGSAAGGVGGFSRQGDEERRRRVAETVKLCKGGSGCSVKSPDAIVEVHSPPVVRVMSPPSRRSPGKEAHGVASVLERGGGLLEGVCFVPGVDVEAGGGGVGGGGRKRTGGGGRVVGRGGGGEGSSSSPLPPPQTVAAAGTAAGGEAGGCECLSSCAPGFFKQLSLLRERGMLTPAQGDAVRRLAIKSDSRIQSIYRKHKKRPMVCAGGAKCLECGKAPREPPLDMLARELLAIL